jgi:hypothetical protein
MTFTLLLCVAAIALGAVFAVKPFNASETVVIDEKPDLSDPTVETLVGNSGPAESVHGDWHVTQVDTLRDAEDFLDALEAQGVEYRELLILGNATFAVRWR